MRAPWISPSGKDFSWSTLWMNLAAFVTVFKFAFGADLQIDWGALVFHPSALDPAITATVMGSLAGLYGWRRSQENQTDTVTKTSTETVKVNL